MFVSESLENLCADPQSSRRGRIAILDVSQPQVSKIMVCKTGARRGPIGDWLLHVDGYVLCKRAIDGFDDFLDLIPGMHLDQRHTVVTAQPPLHGVP